MKKSLLILLALACLTGCACGADISEIRGFEKKLEYQYLLLGTYPYEEDGTEAPLKWRILAREGDVVTLITEDIIDCMQVMFVDNYVDGIKKKNFPKLQEFRETDLYAWVNGEMTDTILKDQDFSEAIVLHDGDRFYIMSWADLMNTDYGFPHTKSGNTVEQEGEVAVAAAKYRKAYGSPYARNKLIYPDWNNERNKNWNKLFQFAAYGNSSPYWSTKMRPNTKQTGIVGGNGHLSWGGQGDVQKGVRPAVMVDLSRLKITGGSGTLDDPWMMEMKE